MEEPNSFYFRVKREIRAGVSVQKVLVMVLATVVVHENMEFHLNVNVCRQVYSRNTHDGSTLEREIPSPNSKGVLKVFLAEIRSQRDRNCQYMLGIHVP